VGPGVVEFVRPGVVGLVGPGVPVPVEPGVELMQSYKEKFIKATAMVTNNKRYILIANHKYLMPKL
jgi:hypothetical protein